ncbi:pectate lyase 1 [Fusarium pseudocircinatum]|uniref:Short-chain dehydrogenase/reductase 3 n=1 Tax=Fusarium pseudocircinatum TaxID=56676 RepID=A0A8H5PM81_9HYPO|nr:pectate lyase 1 [Fusarium pseudocircinatum]
MKLSSVLCGVFATLTVAFPKEYLSLATWGVEGYAKDNPIGITTGGKGGKTVTVTTAEELVAAVKGTEPKIVKLKGKVTLPSRLKVGSNTSLIGVGLTAHITGAGVDVFHGDNVILQNLKVTHILDNDCITIRNSTRVWVDHNEFSSDINQGPDHYDGQVDIIRASDWITVSWNYFHDHWKSSLVGNDATFRDLDFGHLHVTYHHNYWRNMGTRGPAGRFGHQHVYNNLYEDFLYQAIHSRSDNQVLVEGNVFRGNTSEALSTYGLVIPMDSPNTCTCGDEELDGYANLGAKNDWGKAGVNITQKGNFYNADYKYKLTPLKLVPTVAKLGAGVGRICYFQFHKILPEKGETRPPPPVACLSRVHVSKANDTCDSLALKYSVSSAEIFINNPDILQCDDMVEDVPICLPFQCNTYQVKENDTCASVSEFLGITIKDFKSLNPWSSGGAYKDFPFGKFVCTTPSDGHYNRTINKSGPADSNYADEVVPRPENADPTANQQCGRWYTVEEEDDCLSVLGQHDMSLSLFTAANPSISPRNCTASLIPGQAYCVGPTKNALPESYAPPAHWRHGCYFSGNEDFYRPTLALAGPRLNHIKPLSISSCQAYCLSLSLPVFGLQNRDTCICDDRLRMDSRPNKRWGCESRCGYGYEDSSCGPEQHPVEVFSSQEHLAVEYVNIGCFESKEEYVLLGENYMEWRDGTLEECAYFCHDSDYFALQTKYYSPVEQDNFCICGNQLKSSIEKLKGGSESADENGDVCKGKGGTNIYTTNSNSPQTNKSHCRIDEESDAMSYFGAVRFPPEGHLSSLSIPIRVVASSVMVTSLFRSLMGIIGTIGICFIINKILNRIVLYKSSTPQSWDWSKEIVLITGGSGGIGSELVNEFSRRYIKVVSFDIHTPKSTLSANAHFYKVDVTSPHSIHEAMEQVRRDIGDPTVLINNAGIALGKDILACTADQIKKMVEVNLLAHFWLVQELLLSMVKQNHGHVVTIASVASFITIASNIDYSCTKASLVAFHEGLTQDLKHRYKARDVLTSIIFPYWVRTPLIQNLTTHSTFHDPLQEPNDVAEAILDHVLNGRRGNLFLPGYAGLLSGIRGFPAWMQEMIRDSKAGVLRETSF